MSRHLNLKAVLWDGFFLGLAVLLTIASSSVAADRADFMVAGLTWGLTADQVEGHLGSPDKVRSPHFDWVSWDYGGLTVTFRDMNAFSLDFDPTNMRLDGLTTTREGDCLGERICIGDDIEMVKRIIGKSFLIHTSDAPPSFQLSAPHEPTCWVQIMFDEKNSASKIKLACQP